MQRSAFDHRMLVGDSKSCLVVGGLSFPTHLKTMRKSNWIILPRFGVKKTYQKKMNITQLYRDYLPGNDHNFGVFETYFKDSIIKD